MQNLEVWIEKVARLLQEASHLGYKSPRLVFRNNAFAVVDTFTITGADITVIRLKPAVLQEGLTNTQWGKIEHFIAANIELLTN